MRFRISTILFFLLVALSFVYVNSRKEKDNSHVFMALIFPFIIPLTMLFFEDLEIFPKIILYSMFLFPILIFALPIIYLIIHDKNDSSKTSFHTKWKKEWSLRLSAPKNFPINGEFCQVYDKNDTEIASYKFMQYDQGMGYDLSYKTKEAMGSGTPKYVDISCYALAERTKYTANIEFNEEEHAIIKQHFDEGYEGQSSHQLYESFGICCLPGGQLKFHLFGIARCICLDFDRQCKMVRERRKEWERTMDFTQDVPYGLWDKYFHRYNYTFKVIFDEPKELSIYYEYPQFTNGEFYKRSFNENPTNYITNPSIVRNYSFRWVENGSHYECTLFFNENNILQTFEKAFLEHPNEEAILQINVGTERYNYNVSLNIEQQSYKLSSIEYIVWKLNLKDKYSYGWVEYCNYCEKKGKHKSYDFKNHFMGF